MSFLFSHVKTALIRKKRLVSKFMMSQPGKQTIVMHILTNIPKNKGNQAMKFGQLIEYNMRKNILKNHKQNEVEKLFQTLF